MKKRIIATLAILALFAMAIAAYAYTRTNTVTTDRACCCKSADSCPMKGKGHDDKAGGHEMSCCKKHGAEHAKDTEHAKAEGHSCCACCGDSCPMKKKEGAAVTQSTATGDQSNCCDNCDCCKEKKQTSTV